MELCRSSNGTMLPSEIANSNHFLQLRSSIPNKQKVRDLTSNIQNSKLNCKFTANSFMRISDANKSAICARNLCESHNLIRREFADKSSDY